MSNSKYKELVINHVLSSKYFFQDEYSLFDSIDKTEDLIHSPVFDDEISLRKAQYEDGIFDYIELLIRKINQIGSNFLLFEENKPVHLQFVEPEDVKLDFSKKNLLLDEDKFIYPNIRHDEKINNTLNFNEQISIELDDISGENIAKANFNLELSDGSNEKHIFPPDFFDDYVEVTGHDLIIEAYKNNSQVSAFNWDDKYFLSALDQDYNWIEGEERYKLIIEYPHISPKYQSLVPLLKKFIRQDLLLDNSILNPTKLIKSIDIVPSSQNELYLYVNVSNSNYQRIFESGDEKELNSYKNDFQNELNKVSKRLNKLISNHCDLECSIILNCRTKNEQFNIIAKKRLQEIVHQIGTLKNLTNSQYYQSDNRDWEKIQRQLIDSVYDLDRYVRYQSDIKKDVK